MNTKDSTQVSIECGFCQKEYRPSESPESLCRACPSSRTSCGKSRCPHCFYDNPLPMTRSTWLTRLLGKKS
jgi:hypothetical protein